MKIFLLSFVIALFFLLPEMAELADVDLPNAVNWLEIPSLGLGYMCVFFHEIGHTILYWSFGEPALPTFDFTYGGGFSYALERSDILLGGVYVLMLCGLGFLFQQKLWLPLIAACVLIAAHAALAFTNGHEIVTLYMGQGAEVLVGGFCILRAFLGTTSYGMGERYLNMVFGLYALGHSLLLAFGLIFNEFARAAYGEQKGGHALGDFDRIADALHVHIQAVGWFSVLFTLSVFAAACFFGINGGRDSIDPKYRLYDA